MSDPRSAEEREGWRIWHAREPNPMVRSSTGYFSFEIQVFVDQVAGTWSAILDTKNTVPSYKVSDSKAMISALLGTSIDIKDMISQWHGKLSDLPIQIIDGKISLKD